MELTLLSRKIKAGMRPPRCVPLADEKFYPII
jgi:hypothetical protein